MANVIVKDDQVIRFPATRKMLEKLALGSSISDTAPLPVTANGYTLLTPVPSEKPEGEVVTEITPTLTNGDWVQTWEARDMTPTEFAAYKQKVKEQVTTNRYNAETGGMTVNGSIVAEGVVVDTNRESQAMLNGAHAFVQQNPEATIDWKGENGWVTIDAATVTAMATAVGAHVQACFSKEKELHQSIDAAADLTTLNNINITDGWPS